MEAIDYEKEPYKSAKAIGGKKNAYRLINLIGQAKSMVLTFYPDIKLITNTNIT